MIITADATCCPLPSTCARLIYADPPRLSGNVDSIFFIDQREFETFTTAWVSEANRLADHDSWLIVFLDSHIRKIVEPILDRFFFNFYQEVIWHFDFGLYTRKRFVPSHENILVYRRGNPRYYWEANAIPSQRLLDGDHRADQRGRNLGTVLSIPRVPGNCLTRKYIGRNRTSHPEKLAEIMVNAFTIREDLVVDLFCGSGTVPKVCKRIGRPCISMDINSTYVKQAYDRVYNDWKTIIY